MWIVALVTLVGGALRIYFLNSALWYDEIVTLVESARAPFTRIITHYPNNNDHPLYSVLAHLSIAAFGEHAWSLRLPAAVFGIAALPMLYVFGRRVAGSFEAIAATALLAVSYHHVWFSQNARGYTILLFCALLATHLLLIALRENRRSAYLGYAVVCALAAYTHLTMVLMAVTHAAIVAAHLLARRRGHSELREWSRPLWAFLLAGALTLILYAPLLDDVLAFFGQKSEGARVATAGWAIIETFRGLQLGFAASVAVAIGGVIFMAGVWSYFRQSPTLLALFLLPGIVLFTFAVVLHRPIFPRFFFFLAGFGLLIVVRGATVLGNSMARRLPVRAAAGGRKWAPAALIGGLAAVSIIALPSAYRYPKQDYEQALQYVESHAGIHDTVVLAGIGTAYPYQNYYGKPWKRVTSAADLAATRERYQTVWLLYTFRSYIETLESELMNDILARCEVAKAFPGTMPGGSIVVRRCTR
jgi:uncharacterized membrane protein